MGMDSGAHGLSAWALWLLGLGMLGGFLDIVGAEQHPWPPAPSMPSLPWGDSHMCPETQVRTSARSKEEHRTPCPCPSRGHCPPQISVASPMPSVPSRPEQKCHQVHPREPCSCQPPTCSPRPPGLQGQNDSGSFSPRSTCSALQMPRTEQGPPCKEQFEAVMVDTLRPLSVTQQRVGSYTNNWSPAGGREGDGER